MEELYKDFATNGRKDLDLEFKDKTSEKECEVLLKRQKREKEKIISLEEEGKALKNQIKEVQKEAKRITKQQDKVLLNIHKTMIRMSTQAFGKPKNKSPFKTPKISKLLELPKSKGNRRGMRAFGSMKVT